MFTGIIEETGRIETITPKPRAIELVVRAKICGRQVKIGDSIAVNGCCLTVERITSRGAAKLLHFALLAESWKLTNFQFARPGSLVNLERALRVGDRLGGHFVNGHIDGLGKIVRSEPSGKDHILEISASPSVLRYIIGKGSIAVDGISLTVGAVRKKSFETWIIPQTLQVTALAERQVGDAVNLETDLIGKYIWAFSGADGSD
ncbi:MAG TPA: riboflavin synthase [Candidatus Saccharimonadales bacterium]|nr:riboflavin synthase [Candidatus Saccharimonadales bacterium]